MTVMVFCGMSYAGNGNLLLKAPDNSQVMDISENGKYATGTGFSGSNRAFLWIIEENQIIWLSPDGETSEGHGVSNDGVVSGIFMDSSVTENGAPVVSGGYWKDGQWSSLELLNGAFVTSLDGGSVAWGISADGQYISGAQYVGGKFKPCIWKNGMVDRMLTTPVASSDGVAYDVSNDGSMACGWTFAVNDRAAFLWAPEPIKLGEGEWVTDAAYKFSPNDNLVVGTDMNGIFIYTISDKSIFNVPLVNQEPGSWSATYVGNDKTVLGFESEIMEFTPFAIIYKQDIGSMKLTAYLEQYEDFVFPSEDFLLITQSGGMSNDGKILTGLGVTPMGNYRGYAIVFDTEIDHRAPVQLSSSQISGRFDNSAAVKLEWKAPISNMENVSGYNIYKDGVKINSASFAGTIFVDNDVTIGQQYSYNVSAIYKDGTESAMGLPSVIKIKSYYTDICQPVTFLNGRQEGYNSALLQWNKPIYGDATLSWYKGSIDLGIGIDFAQYYYGAKFDKQTLGYYSNAFEITEVEFFPMEGPAEFTIVIKSDNATLYEQVLDDVELGVSNIIKLDNPVTIPENTNLLVAIKVKALTGNPIYPCGIDNNSSYVGYGDLFSEDGLQWTSIYTLSEGAISGNWGIAAILTEKQNGTAKSHGISLINDKGFDIVNETSMNVKIQSKKFDVAASPKAGMNGKQLTNYQIFRDGALVGESYNINEDMVFYTDPNLGNGQYSYQVTAVYTTEVNEGSDKPVDYICVSEKTDPFIIKVVAGTEPCTAPQNLKAVQNSTADINVSWSVPMGMENIDLSYSNWKKGIEITLTTGDGSLGTLMGAIVFDKNRTSLYEGFHISDFVFYPAAKIKKYTFYIMEGNSTIYDQVISDYKVGEINTIALDTPIDINPQMPLTIIIKAEGIADGGKSLVADSSLPFVGFGNLFSNDLGQTYEPLTNIDVYGNWMMGVNIDNGVISRNILADDKIMYNVYMDNLLVNPVPVSEENYVIMNPTLGSHEVYVTAVYNNCGEKQSEPVTVIISDGVEDLDNSMVQVFPNPANNFISIQTDGKIDSVSIFDMSGRVLFNGGSINIIDLSDINTGIYMLKVETQGKVLTKKINVVK